MDSIENIELNEEQKKELSNILIAQTDIDMKGSNYIIAAIKERTDYLIRQKEKAEEKSQRKSIIYNLLKFSSIFINKSAFEYLPVVTSEKADLNSLSVEGHTYAEWKSASKISEAVSIMILNLRNEIQNDPIKVLNAFIASREEGNQKNDVLRNLYLPNYEYSTDNQEADLMFNAYLKLGYSLEDIKKSIIDNMQLPYQKGKKYDFEFATKVSIICELGEEYISNINKKKSRKG